MAFNIGRKGQTTAYSRNKVSRARAHVAFPIIFDIELLNAAKNEEEEGRIYRRGEKEASSTHNQL